jgi:hypothetical protein
MVVKEFLIQKIFLCYISFNLRYLHVFRES